MAGALRRRLPPCGRGGGVLEHPAYSDAWAAHGLNAPPGAGGWVAADWIGGWTCHVEQGRYGHRAKKATWLYAHGVALPALEWSSVPDNASAALVSWCGNHVSSGETRPRVGKRAAAATPPRFRDALIGMARSAQTVEHQDKRERAATPALFRDVLIAIARSRD